MIKKLRDFHELPPRAKKFWLAAAWLALAMRLLLTIAPFPVLRALVAKLHKLHDVSHRVDADTLNEIAWAVRSAARWVPIRGTCLIQALVGQILCACCGQPVTLCIGVTKSKQGTFEAHAWLVTSEGKTLIGQVPNLKYFVPFEGVWAENGARSPARPPTSLAH